MLNHKATPNSFTQKNAKRNIIVIVAIVLVYFILTNINVHSDALTPEGQKILALMVCGIIAWVFEVVPLCISAGIIVCLIPVLDIFPLPEAFGFVGQPLLFFVVGCFCIAAALRRCGIARRLNYAAIIISKGKPGKLLFLFMAISGIISMFISDLAITAMLFPIALTVLKENKMKAGESNYGKSMMLGIPMAALIGGIGTPAGAPMNYLALSLLEEAGLHISFLQWSCFGIPIVIILIPITWWALIKIYPSEVDKLEGVANARSEYANLGKINANEVKFVIIFVITVFCWVTEIIPLPITSFIAGALFFFPGIGINDSDTVKNEIDWNVVIFNVCANALGVAVMTTGAAVWISNTFFSGMTSLSPLILMVIISVFTVLILKCTPFSRV